MPPHRSWPTHAEHVRLDIIALALDVQFYTSEAQEAFLAHDLDRFIEINQRTFEAALKQQQMLKEARRQS